MSDQQLQILGDDIATAIRAHGQLMADKAREAGVSQKSAEFIQQCFSQAAEAAELRTVRTLMFAAVERAGRG